MIISALKKKKEYKAIKHQTPEEQMYLLKLAAHQILGEKWIFYKKIKQAGGSGKLFKSKDITEEMKATQSALKFTSRNATRQYRAAYQTALKDLKTYTGSTEAFPQLGEESEGDSLSSLTSEYDAVIISWTPIKFLLPGKQIREKGAASQRHTEGLIAKLYFKVLAYYANPRNWDRQKLSFYLRKLDKNSSYQDVVMALEPLKKDLSAFSEQYEPFKFGKAALSKDVTQDADAFDDAMEDESFDSQVRMLYWHRFIYEAMELFLFRYYLTLATSTASIPAIRYLSNIFEPALKQAIENKMIFIGSFDTDVSKRPFQRPLENYKRERLKDAATKRIKTQMGIFEIFNYNLPLLQRAGIRFSLTKIPTQSSGWLRFARHYILGVDRTLESPIESSPAKSLEEREARAQRKLALKELANSRGKIEEAYRNANGELNDLKQAYEDLKPDGKEKSLLQKKKSTEAERKNLEFRLIKLEKDKNRLSDEKNIQQAKQQKESPQSSGQDDIQKELEDADAEIMRKRNEIARFEKLEAKLENNLTALKEKAKQLQDNIKQAEKNAQGINKKIEEIGKKIGALQEEERLEDEDRIKAEAEARAKLGDLNSPETRYSALAHIMNMMINCMRYQKTAKNELLKRFEKRMAQDQELAKKRVEQIKKETDKKVREMRRKVSKLKRMKQEAAAADYQKDLDQFKQKSEKKCDSIVNHAKAVAAMQRKRLGRLQCQIEQDKLQSDARPAKNLIALLNQISNEAGFQKSFKDFVVEFISERYINELTPFYRNLFEIVDASALDKTAIIQAMQKSGGADAVPLSLTDSEQKSYDALVSNMKDRINEAAPYIFETSVDLHSSRVMIDQLLDLHIDNASLAKALSLKVSSSKNPKPARLQSTVINSLLSLNNLINPVPFHSVLAPGRENEKDPLKSIDISLLNKLVAESKSKTKAS